MHAIKGTLKEPVKTMKRLMRSMSGDESRPILCAAHLDENGDAVSTDSYRLGIVHKAWDGPSIDLDLGTAYDIAHHKGRCKSAAIEVKGTAVKVTMDDGAVIDGRIREGKYPNYSIIASGDYATGITVDRDELLAAVREMVKAKSDVLICTDGVHASVSSSLGKCATAVSFKDCAVGAANEVCLNSTYLRDALNGIEGNHVELRITSAIKPVAVAEGDMNVRSKVGFRSYETYIMPVRFDAREEKGWKKAPKRKEPKMGEKLEGLKGEKVCITGTLTGMARSEAFTRLKLVGGIPRERFTKDTTVLVIAGNSGKCKREQADKAIAAGQNVKVVTGTEFLRALEEAQERKPKKEEKVERKPEKVNREGLAELLYALAIDRAAKDPHNRLTEGNTSPGSDAYVWRLQKDGRLAKAEYGNLTSWYLDGEFVTCIERRYSKRKVELYYPEVKPVAHRSDLVASRKALEAEAKEKAGAKVEANVTEHADVTAIEMTPKKEDDMEKRIAELEKELKDARKELEEVWKENETLKAKPKAAKPKAAKPKAEKPKAEKPKAPKPPKADAAEVVSLEFMQAWAQERGLVASQKAEGCCIWVEGESKPYKEELVSMGFRFASKRKSWYIDPKRVA